MERTARWPEVAITLLGQVTAGTCGGPRCELRSPRAQVAFALLVLERRRVVGRDELADAVWTGRLPASWRSALRNVVKDIRDFLVAAFPDGRDPLVTENGLHHLSLPAHIQSDIELARRMAQQGRGALEAGRFSEARRSATRSCRLLRTPFLPNHDGEWVTTVRDRLAELLQGALETASRAALALGHWPGALAAADEAVSRAPLRESAHRCRMAAHAAAGNRGEALRAYYRLRGLLADELGVDPAPETEDMYLSLLGAGVSASGSWQGEARLAPLSLPRTH